MPLSIFPSTTVKVYAIALIASCLSSSLVIATSKYSPQRRMLRAADDDAFLDRHENAFVDKDAVPGDGNLIFPSLVPSVAPSNVLSSLPSSTPSESECITTEGKFGTETSVRIDLSYNYEVEVKADSLDRMESEIIPAVEDAIVQSLLTKYFTDCARRRLTTDDSNSLRSSRKRTSGKIRGRQLGVQGISSLPKDEYTDKKCSSESLTAENCAVVKGSMSFYLSEGTRSIDVDTAGGQALDLIKEKMNSGFYSDSHDEIIAILFIDDDLNKPGDNSIETTIIPGAQEGQIGGRSYGTIAIASCAILALVALLAAAGRRKERNKNRDAADDDEEEDQERNSNSSNGSSLSSSSGSSINDSSQDSSYESSPVGSYDSSYDSSIISTNVEVNS